MGFNGIYPLVNFHITMENPPCFMGKMGKSTISMAIFHCYVSSPEGNGIKWGCNLRRSIEWNPTGLMEVESMRKKTSSVFADKTSFFQSHNVHVHDRLAGFIPFAIIWARWMQRVYFNQKNMLMQTDRHVVRSESQDRGSVATASIHVDPESWRLTLGRTASLSCPASRTRLIGCRAIF